MQLLSCAPGNSHAGPACCPHQAGAYPQLLMSVLRLILGDQLNEQHSWFRTPPDQDDAIYVMMEIRSETDYARHHIQKIVGFFLAMRHFAARLTAQGRRVHYLKLHDPQNRQSFTANLTWLAQYYQATAIAYQLPDEHRLDIELAQLSSCFNIPVHVVDSEHFLSERDAVQRLFSGKKTYLMETFYRSIRRRYQLLMEEDGSTPLTGQWNYDQDNRQPLPAAVDIPPVLHFEKNAHDVYDEILQAGIITIGRLEDPSAFDWPTSRAEHLQLLQHFIQHRLRAFGTYQDAMTSRHDLLFHARISFGLNTKMIHPLEVIEAAVQSWRENPAAISFAQVEGFVRQIAGWREFMRGVYWAQMPAYANTNYFNHQAKLPEFYWTGRTKMRCLAHAIGQSLDSAYAHHIQRLMITGNFALLLGVRPDYVDQWYLGVYMDAIEWVELTNTRGMSQYADGGLLATKPYVSSGNYIHKMSDYCGQCPYNPKEKTASNACPFNSLYWDFMHRHRQLLANNPRIGMAYKNWDRMDELQRQAVLEKAAWVKDNVNSL